MPEVKPLALDFSGFRDLPEDTMEQIGAKAKRFKELRKGQTFVRTKAAADLYVAAFLLPKVGGAPAGASERTVPTSEELWIALNQGKMRQAMVEAPKAARTARALHWPLEFPDVMQRGGFDAVVGNPPWEKYTILEREFFAAIPEIVAEANASKRKKIIEDELKRSPILAEAWSAAQRGASAKGDFVRGSGRFPQSAVGELNLYPLFAELATHLTKRAGWTGLILKSLMFTGSTWKGFTDHLVTSGRLRAVFDFKNWEMLFSSVGYHERYSLTTMGPERPDTRMQLAVGLTNPAQLSNDSSVIPVDRAFPRRVNPETGTLPQCETPEDLRILTRVAEELPTLGQSDWNARYTSGLHMTSDAAELRDREGLEAEGYQLRGSWFLHGSEEFAPVYEGKFIHQYDHRFATFDGISVDKRFGIKAATINPTEDQKGDRELEIVPRYWVRRRFFEENARARGVSMDWNIAFRDTTNVISNFRTAVGCVVGPTAFNYKCPNVVIASGDAVASALFLSMFNSVPYDYLLRQKFYGANFTKSMLLQTFVVSRAAITQHEAKLLDAVAALTNTSRSVEGFCRLLGRDHLCVNDTKDRIELRAWIDALYFDLFGFGINEVEYVFDTFPIWRDKSTEAWGSFYEKERTLALFTKLKHEAA